MTKRKNSPEYRKFAISSIQFFCKKEVTHYALAKKIGK